MVSRLSIEGFEILPYFQANKLGCHSFIDADKIHESGSETKDFNAIAHLAV